MVSGHQQRDATIMSHNMYNDLVFKKKSMRIDWRKIAVVDLDRIAREMDVYALQENIDHLTFCNIDAELDTRLIDPTYIKLFKMSQLTIEYLMHSQNYLTDVISTVEGQLNKALADTDQYKASHEKLQKELIEVKKENKKRKKMIETQQGLINVNSSNYHNCNYCSKVFLNVTYLQAHITRRHPDMEQNGHVSNQISKNLNTEIEKELDRIKDRLRVTENELAQEKSARLAGMSNAILPAKTREKSASHDTAELIKQMDSIKNAELKRQKEEFKKVNEGFKTELKEMNAKNAEFEREIKDLQEKLGKKSNVGWIKDDIDVQKDSALKQKLEIERLNLLLEDYESQVDELKTKWKAKEAVMKKKHEKELNEKEEEILELKAKLAELQNAIGKTDDQLIRRLEQLQNELLEEQKQRHTYELELAELKNRPPPVTPRHQQQPTPEPLNRSLSPAKPVDKPQKPERPTEKPQTKPAEVILAGAVPKIPKKLEPTETIDTYLPDYCPLTLKALQKNPELLTRFKAAAIKNFNEELDQLGIDRNDKTLSTNDFIQKSNELGVFRRETSEQLPIFNQIRLVFAEINEKYANQKLSASMKSTGNRVTFKSDLIAKDKLKNITNNHLLPRHSQQHQRSYSETMQSIENSKSEETDDDVSLSNALESNDDDTEPTKSLVTENLTISKRTPSPRKQTRNSSHINNNNSSFNQEEISDLESISQLLTDRSGPRKSKALTPNTGMSRDKAGSKVEENRRKIESQLSKAYAKGSKPSPNAIAVGRSNSNNQYNNLKNESFSSISEMDNEASQKRPRNGLKSNLSESSSIWISETHEISNTAPNHNSNNIINKVNDLDRPATANSLKTSNFDSDEETVPN